MSQETPIRRPKLFGFAFYERSNDGRWRLHLRWGRILSLFLSLTIIGWLSCGLGLYLFFKYKRDYDEVSYAKMLILPLRYEQHRSEMGNYHIEKAKELFAEGDFGPGITFLRAGVMRATENIEGRLLLAEIFLSGYRQPEMAIELLKQGAPYGYQDIDYVRSTVRLMLRQHQDMELLQLADEFLPKLSENEQVAKIFAVGSASAAFYRGMYDTAEDFINEYDLKNSPEGLILSSKILSARGQNVDAIVLLENNANRFSNRELIFMELIRAHREAGNLDKARQYAILRNLNNPLNPGPRIELLHAYNYSEQTDRLAEEIDNYIDQFGSEERSLALLAEFGAKTGNASLNRDIYNLAIENSFDLSLFSYLVIEAENSAGNFKDALNLVAQILEEKPIWLDERSPILSALRAVSYYGDGQDAKGSIYLKEILQNPDVRNQTLLALSTTLKDLGRLEEARSILEAAYEETPENQGALSALMRLDIELGRIDDLNEKLVNLLSMRRPPYDLLQLAYDSLGSDKFMFTPNRNSVIQQLAEILRERSANSSGV
ncbi:MAG: tetratricopeptide repeat protein [Opitutales bacterium]